MQSGSCEELWLEVESNAKKDGKEKQDEIITEDEKVGVEDEAKEDAAFVRNDRGWLQELSELRKPLSEERKNEPIYTLNSSRITQGGLFEIRCISSRDEVPSISGNIEGVQPFIKTGEKTYTALIPTDYLSQTGAFEVVCGYEGEERKYVLEVLPRDFHTQYLEIDEDIVEETRTEEAFLEFNRYYYAAITDDSYQPSVSSISEMDFLWPTSGIITTTYGEARYVNGEATNVYHRGIDIAGEHRDEVYASADGRVNLAKNLVSSGNTIIISHGFGVYTSYFHLDELAVKQGQTLKKGDLIGYQGTTGFSTGVHLHFELSVRDTTLEPGYYILGREVDY